MEEVPMLFQGLVKGEPTLSEILLFPYYLPSTEPTLSFLFYR